MRKNGGMPEQGLLRKIHKLHFFDYLRRWEPTKYIINYSQKMSSFLKQYKMSGINLTVKILTFIKNPTKSFRIQ